LGSRFCKVVPVAPLQPPMGVEENRRPFMDALFHFCGCIILFTEADLIHDLQALSELSWMQKSNGEYPLPTQPQMKPKLARDMLDFDLSSIQPKAGIACVKKWVENPEFTAEKAGEHSLAARAMVEWVRAADVYFKERKSRPTGEQIEVRYSFLSGFRV
jgi:hypothetical protein